MDSHSIIYHLHDIESKLSQLTQDDNEKRFHNYLLFSCMACIKARYLIDEEEKIDAVELKILAHIRVVYRRLNRDAGKWHIIPFKVYSSKMREAKERLQNK